MTAGAESSFPGFLDTHPWSPLSATHDYRHCRLLLYSPKVTFETFQCLHVGRKENLCQTGTTHSMRVAPSIQEVQKHPQQHTKTLHPFRFTFIQTMVSQFLEVSSISRGMLLLQGQVSQCTLSCLAIPLGRLQAVPAHNSVPKHQLQSQS